MAQHGLLASWSRRHAWPAEVVPASGAADWRRLIARARREGRPLIARGAGLSWTDSAMTRGGLVAATASMDRVLAFDAASGRLVAEGGVSLRRILDLVAPRGWWLSSLPGSLDVTLGGAIAGNVHGKDSFRAGAFASQVETIDLVDGTGKPHRLERAGDAEGFAATAGGLGLTGLVAAASLRLTPLPTESLDLREVALDGADALAGMAAACGPEAFAWGWLDPTAAAGGRVAALVRLARWDGRPAPTGRRHGAGATLPWGRLAPFAANDRLRQALTLAFALRRRLPRRRQAGWREALFPHARLGGLEHLFRRGFVETQAIVPGRRLVELFGRLADGDGGAGRPFLVSVKCHGPADGHLAFAGDGIGLSFVTAAEGVGEELLERRRAGLRAALLACGGRLNLGRDASPSVAEVRAMYPAFDRFLAAKRRFDPDGLLASAWWARLAQGAT